MIPEPSGNPSQSEDPRNVIVAHLPDEGEGSIAACDGWVEAGDMEGWLSHLGQIHAGDLADGHGRRHLQQNGNSRVMQSRMPPKCMSIRCLCTADHMKHMTQLEMREVCRAIAVTYYHGDGLKNGWFAAGQAQHVEAALGKIRHHLDLVQWHLQEHVQLLCRVRTNSAQDAILHNRLCWYFCSTFESHCRQACLLLVLQVVRAADFELGYGTAEEGEVDSV